VLLFCATGAAAVPSCPGGGLLAGELLRVDGGTSGLLVTAAGANAALVVVTIRPAAA
jgi:hypothetical protein